MISFLISSLHKETLADHSPSVVEPLDAHASLPTLRPNSSTGLSRKALAVSLKMTGPSVSPPTGDLVDGKSAQTQAATESGWLLNPRHKVFTSMSLFPAREAARLAVSESRHVEWDIIADYKAFPKPCTPAESAPKPPQLPREILILVFEELVEVASLKCLRLVSRLFNDLSSPIIYRHIILSNEMAKQLPVMPTGKNCTLTQLRLRLYTNHISIQQGEYVPEVFYLLRYLDHLQHLT